MKKNYLSCFNWNIFQSIIDFIFPSSDEKLSGTLVVSGAGWLEFKFKQHPSKVFVHFEGECDPIPCDPGLEDILDWKIIHGKKYHILVIEWDVNSVRTISWKICD